MTEMIRKDENNFDLLGFQIEQMSNMAKAVKSIYDEVKATKREMQASNNETKKELAEVKEMQRTLNRHVVLTRGETAKLKALILNHSKYITHDFFKGPVSDELYDAKRGHTISYLWTVLKMEYDVSTYPEIPHIEFENAMNLVRKLTVNDFPKAYYRLTPKVKEVAKEHDGYVEYVQFEDTFSDGLFDF